MSLKLKRERFLRDVVEIFEMRGTMLQYYAPVIIVIFANTLYHICAKAMPSNANPLALLVVTYLVSAAAAFILFLLTDTSRDFASQMKYLTWVPVVFGLCLVILEFGFILIYRAGWNISLAALVCNIALALILIGVGVLLYKEHIGGNQLIGIAFCITGLIFINR